MEQRTHNSPHARLRDLPAGAARWTGGFWHERFEVCRTAMVPNMWELMSRGEARHAFTNFRVAAGLEQGSHRGPKFSDGDFYKWLEAASAVLAVTRLWRVAGARVTTMSPRRHDAAAARASHLQRASGACGYRGASYPGQPRARPTRLACRPQQ